MKHYLDMPLGTEPMHPIIARVLILLLGMLIGASVMVVTGVQAATPNGCEYVGTIGNVIVSMCSDDLTNSKAWANSAGFLAPVQ